MAYEKNTWANGDVISADLLNHIETGIEEAAAGGGTNFLAIELTYNESTGNYDLNKSWQEIYDAFSTGKPCIITDNSNNGAKIQVLVVYQAGSENYYVEFMDREQTIRSCSTDSPNGFPGYGT